MLEVEGTAQKIVPSVEHPTDGLVSPSISPCQTYIINGKTTLLIENLHY